MIRFRFLLCSLLLGVVLSAATVGFLRAQAVDPGVVPQDQAPADARRNGFALVADLSGSMKEELDAFQDFWSHPPFRPNQAEMFQLVSFNQAASDAGKTASIDQFSSWIEALATGEEGPCPTAALPGLGQLVRNTPGSPLLATDGLLITDGAPNASAMKIAFITELMLRRGIRLNALVSGWCDGGPLPKSVMGYMVEASGGRLFHPDSAGDYISETLAAFIIINNNDMAFTRLSQSGSEVTGTVDVPVTPDTETIGAEVSDADPSDDDDPWWWGTCLTCLIPSPYILPMMTSEPGNLKVALRDPDGKLLDPYVTVETADRTALEVRAQPGESLKPGIWQLVITGGSLYRINVKVTSNLHFAYLGPSWSHQLGRANHIRAAIYGDTALGEDPPIFRLTSLTGKTTFPLNLFDDGQHFDGVEGDGIYGGVYTPTVAGFFYVEARGTTQDGSEFVRQDPAPVRVRRFHLPDLPPRTVSPGSTERLTFTLGNGNPPLPGPAHQLVATDTTYSLDLFSSQGWAVTHTLPATITIPSNASIEIGIDLLLPANARYGLVEETTLVVSELGDISTSATASAMTTVRAPYTLFLPTIVQEADP